MADLTARQLELARLVAQGRRNKQIARGLQIAENTVRAHLSEIYLRLGLEDGRVGLTRWYVGRYGVPE